MVIVPGVAGVSLAAVFAGHVQLPAGRWAAPIGLPPVGSPPFGLTVRGKTAILGIVVVFFALAVLGATGSLTGVRERPRHLAPSYSLVQEGNAMIAGHALGIGQTGVLAAWTVLAGAAVLVRRRQSSGS
jgi:ABC-2 type transport system permease protein